MQTNDLVKSSDGTVYRILVIEENAVLAVDCSCKRMPIHLPDTETPEPFSEEELLQNHPEAARSITDIPPEDIAVMHRRYAVIAPVLPFIYDNNKAMQNQMIKKVAELYRLSLPTVRKYLCQYLVFGKMEVLAPFHQHHEKQLSQNEKNFRWALNKYYYTRYKQKLTDVYNTLLREKYTDENGQLLPDYPKFYAFKYYYYKTRKMQTELISRNGIANYKRNDRPLLGSIQDFAPAVGVGMLDSTVCDIYLVNEAAQVVGRPILTLCVDAYSRLICGYLLSWEGGVYSLQELLKNVIADKAEWCRRFGILISPDEWSCSQLPGTLVTDRGTEYVGETFGQIAELGVNIVNLPAFRPELKGIVESAFHQLQELYKPQLKGKGVVEPDANERGVHDYRKDACLTMNDFEKVILHCIIYYNSKRLLDNFPLTNEMLAAQIKPYSTSIWNFGKEKPGAHLIAVEPEQLRLTLLPRTVGKFTRRGLMVHKQRYRHAVGNYTEDYLNGGTAAVAYDSSNMGTVWLYRDGTFTPFELVLKIYDTMSLSEIAAMKDKQKALSDAEERSCTQAKIDLATQIKTITNGCRQNSVSVHNIRKTHSTEKKKRRIIHG